MESQAFTVILANLPPSLRRRLPSAPYDLSPVEGYMGDQRGATRGRDYRRDSRPTITASAAAATHAMPLTQIGMATPLMTTVQFREMRISCTTATMANTVAAKVVKGFTGHLLRDAGSRGRTRSRSRPNWRAVARRLRASTTGKGVARSPC
jgi:hypothetical protein